MSKTVTVKYFAETVFAKEPQKATEESAGYDLYAAEAKTILPGKNELVCLDLRWAIPKGFCDRIFPRSSLIRDHNVTAEAGLIDADYGGLVYVFLFNHSERVFTVRTGDRIAQVVFLEKFDAQFEKVSKKEELGVTKRDCGGFSSTGLTVIKKIKVSEEEEQQDVKESESNKDDDDDDLEITAEERFISVNDKVIFREKIEKK